LDEQASSLCRAGSGECRKTPAGADRLGRSLGWGSAGPSEKHEKDHGPVAGQGAGEVFVFVCDLSRVSGWNAGADLLRVAGVLRVSGRIRSQEVGESPNKQLRGQGRRCGHDAEEMKIKIRIKTEWDMGYRIWDIDWADEERLKSTG